MAKMQQEAMGLDLQLLMPVETDLVQAADLQVQQVPAFIQRGPGADLQPVLGKRVRNLHVVSQVLGVVNPAPGLGPEVDLVTQLGRQV